jgi:creatinine amidohydrolase/Fe(II)-dependent formamide hydrolase-like protein
MSGNGTVTATNESFESFKDGLVANFREQMGRKQAALQHHGKCRPH